jgi:hypothetical protein
MKIERINYQKVFPLGQYINEKLGVEIQLDEGDDFDEVMLKAKDMIEKFHIQSNPQLYTQNKNLSALADYMMDKPHKEEPSIQLEDDRKKPKQSPEEKRWEAIISACCSEKEVEKWRKKVPEALTHLLDKRLTQLKPVKQ